MFSGIEIRAAIEGTLVCIGLVVILMMASVELISKKI